MTTAPSIQWNARPIVTSLKCAPRLVEVFGPREPPLDAGGKLGEHLGLRVGSYDLRDIGSKSHRELACAGSEIEQPPGAIEPRRSRKTLDQLLRVSGPVADVPLRRAGEEAHARLAARASSVRLARVVWESRSSRSRNAAPKFLPAVSR